MNPIKIKENIYWVGAVDWELRNFHGYLTSRGSTYNSYLIIDEKITLIDAVKEQFYDEMIERISKIIDPKKIDIVVQNHVEMDHSGALPKLMDIIPNAELYVSSNGEKGLKIHYRKDWNFKVINPNESLSLGKRSLSFVPTPMVHWPDNMVTYCPEEKILFSNDAFGQHIASSERIDNEFPMNIILEEARKYYANIVLPYGTQVQKVLEIASKLDIEIIAPSHGLVWKKYIKEIFENYKKWASNETEERAIIVYDTMWNSSKKIANAIHDVFLENNISASLFSLQKNHISDVMSELISTKYICVGSPTLNNNMLPTVASFLTYLKGLAPKNRIALAFGSYGWGGQSIGLIQEDLEKCKFNLLNKIRVQYIPTKENLTLIKENLSKELRELKEKK